MPSKKQVLYTLSGTIGVCGLAIAFMTFDVNALLAAVAGNVGLAALIGGLYQLLRDEAAHQKVVWLQHDDQGFQVGATSHMANTVFDKHVLFCEAYVAEVQATIDTLVREHASKEALDHAGKLQEIRRKHATWVTLSMSEQLMQFEAAVRKLGAQAQFVSSTTGSAAHAEQRARTIDEMFAGFEEVLPEMFKREGKDGISAASIVQRVRCMLGIDELVEMRALLITRAHKSLLS